MPRLQEDSMEKTFGARRGAWVASVGLIGALNLVAVTPARAAVVSDWNQHVVTLGGPQIARTLAMFHIAMFDAKYTFNWWRPVTAIRNADIDGNPDTQVDPTWSPLQVTPPHPEYPATHGVVQAAGARIMKAYFGPHYSFSTTAPAVPGVVRTYADFDSFTEERQLARSSRRHALPHLHRGGGASGQAGRQLGLANYLLPLR
jgi:hypothetical protein